MIINQPVLNIEEEHCVISSYIEIESDNSKNDKLWFKVHKKYQESISLNYEPFVVSAIFYAMYLGEDIKIYGSFSPKLAYSINQFQDYFIYWYPKKLKKIKIHCDSYESKVKNKSDSSGCFFSGGLDSFHTLFNNLPEKLDIVQYQIKYCIFVHGFDISLNDEINFQIAKDLYAKVTKELNIEFIEIKSNFKQFIERKSDLSWGNMTHGAALASVSLILSRLLSRVYIASSYEYSQSFPWGSNWITDPLLSTEALEIVHFGSDKSRVDKTKFISQYPLTFNYLRVCWEKIDGINNCCRCEKCLRTMITLKLEDRLQYYKTFPLPLRIIDILNWFPVSKGAILMAKEILQLAKEKNNVKMYWLISFVIYRSSFRLFLKNIFRPIFVKLKLKSDY